MPTRAARSSRPVADPGAELAPEAWRLIRSISSSPETVAAEHDFMHANGLTGGLLRALRELPSGESLSMRQLAGRLGCDNSYVTALVDTLERQGLAQREAHPTDRRIKVIALTEQGVRLAEQARRDYVRPPSAFDALTAAEAGTLVHLLRKLDPA